ncbi:MAG: MotA/TolQ/ExbB proton channel family protein [Pseudomonadota bacterium]
MKTRINTSRFSGLTRSVLVAASLATLAPTSFAQSSMDDLMNDVRREGREISAENREREQEFLSKRNQQRALLDSAKASLAAEQNRSEQLKASFDQNELALTELEETLRIRLGDIGELFGVVRQSAGEAKGMVDSSLLTVQDPDRGDIAAELGQAKKLPTIEELRGLQALLLEEMVGSGEVERFQTEIRTASGQVGMGEVVRVGLFNTVNQDGFLVYSDESGTLQELQPQPAGRYVSPAKSFFDAPAGQVASFPIDPSRGTILGLETQKASTTERINQGGPVGYVIITIGIVGILIALWRFIVLSGMSAKIRKQLKSEQPSLDNPLGRILSVYSDNRNADTETLELKLDEAIMREAPPLEKGQSLIKVFAAVAPLLGLLGTVVGMINTFQAITLFGTGDPKLMAGGISEALVTTMLGLIVAIPLVFLHTLVSGRSRTLIEVLEEQSAGMIARHSERHLQP